MSRAIPLVCVFLIVLGMIILPTSIGRVHAVNTGRVCLADVTSPPSPPCGSGAGPVFDAPLTIPNHQIRIGVFVNSSDGFNTFEIVLKTNSTVLKPAGIDLAGSIVNRPLLIAECLGTVNLLPSKCEGASTSDTLELAVLNFSRAPMHIVTGLLFTAIFNVTAKTSSAVSVGFLNGCAVSSVVGTQVCVAFANGTTTPVPETVQAATFDNSIVIPYLALTTRATDSVKPTLVGSTQSLQLNLTSYNNWDLLCSPCTVALSTAQNSSLTVSLNTTSVSTFTSGVGFATLNVTGSIAGNYSVTVHALYHSFDQATSSPDTLVAHLTIQIQITDFVLSASPLRMRPVLVGTAASSTINVSSLNGFSGNVLLSITPVQCGLSPSNLAVSGSGSSQLSCSWSSIGNYTVALTGGSGPVSHTLSLSVSIQDFAVSVSSSSLALGAGSSNSVDLAVTGLNGFNGTVSLAITAPTGVTVTPSLTSWPVPGTSSLIVSGKTPGVYNVTVTVSASGVSRSAVIQVKVTALPSGSGSPSLFGMSPLLFYGLLAFLAIVAVGVSVVGVRRSRRGVSKPRAQGTR